MASNTTRAELERRTAELEEKLAESQPCLDFFGVDAPAGLVIFDQDCRYVQINQYLARFANLSTAEHIGKKPSELLPPPLAAHLEANIRKILATGEPQLNQSFTLALPGDAEPLRSWLTSRFPLRNAAGSITGVGLVVVEETSLQQLRKSLNQHETLHLALLENIPARIFMKDCAGAYIYCNDIFAADVGIAKAEIVGKNDFDIFRPDMAERYRQADLQVISSGQGNEFEYQFEKDNREYFINVRKTPFRDSEGNILGILGFFDDLSEKRRTERQLFIADHALAATLAGIAIADPAGVLTFANPAFMKMWGCDHAEEVLGRSATEFWTNPSLSGEVIKALHEHGQWQGEMRGLRKDGTSFPTLLAANTVTDPAGNRICMIGSFIDISARKAAENKLLESEEQLRQITDNIDDAVWIMDTAEERLLYVSPAYEKIWGQPREILSRNPVAWLEAVHPDDQERLTSSLRQTGREKKDSYRVIRPDGSIRQVFARTFPVLDVNGMRYREVGIIQDVSEMKEAEAKILAFSRRLNNVVEEERLAIARDLHDEFGQALVRLRQWQKNIGEALPASVQPLVNHEGFDEIVNHLGEIIRNIAHRLRPDILDNIGLAAAIEREVKDFGRRFDSVEVSFQVIGQPRPIASEHALVFYRVLQEALTNVARHAKAKKLQVRLIFSFPSIILTVEDDGVGFDPSKSTSLYEDNTHWGVRGIGERMATIGGRAKIASRPGLGTNIRAEFDEGQAPQPNRHQAHLGDCDQNHPGTENNHAR
jgi:PAS domain S-box-containing protein